MIGVWRSKRSKKRILNCTKCIDTQCTHCSIALELFAMGTPSCTEVFMFVRKMHTGLWHYVKITCVTYINPKYNLYLHTWLTRIMQTKNKCITSNFQLVVIRVNIRSILFMALLKPLCYLTHKQRAIHIFLHWIFAWIIWTLFSSNVRIGISVVMSGSKSSRLVRIYLLFFVDVHHCCSMMFLWILCFFRIFTI